MQVTNELLQKFASIVNNTDDNESTTLEFYGHVEGSEVDGYWTVRPDALTSENTSLEGLNDDNLVQCTSQVAVKNGDQVRYKIDGTDAVIIENLKTPNGNDMIVLRLISPGMTPVDDNPSAGHSGHVLYKFENTKYTKLKEWVNKGYNVSGLSGTYVQISTDNGNTWKILWEDDNILKAIGQTTSLLGWRINDNDVTVVYGCSGYMYNNGWKIKICVDIMLIPANKQTIDTEEYNE